MYVARHIVGFLNGNSHCVQIVEKNSSLLLSIRKAAVCSGCCVLCGFLFCD